MIINAQQSPRSVSSNKKKLFSLSSIVCLFGCPLLRIVTSVRLFFSLAPKHARKSTDAQMHAYVQAYTQTHVHMRSRNNRQIEKRRLFVAAVCKRRSQESEFIASLYTLQRRACLFNGISSCTSTWSMSHLHRQIVWCSEHSRQTQVLTTGEVGGGELC